MKITVVGTGYVGLSLAVLLSQKHEVCALDIDPVKIDKINNRISPFKDNEIEKFLKERDLSLIATNNAADSYLKSQYVIIATPTNYDSETGSFDTSSVEKTILEIIQYNKDAVIIIKSTVPFGFTDNARKQFNTSKIIYSPEFLRESKALYDNLYPSRIIVGDFSKEADAFAKILLDCSNKKSKDVNIFLMKSNEAEAVKLFSNTYLAMRISFFNELDSFSEVNELSSLDVIKGISSDPRIGNYYNNPSFGYGGYCLPKDTQQLLANYKSIPNNIIKAVVDSNITRKEFIVNSILEKSPKTVGVYRLVMKNDSDNFRESAVLDIIKKLQEKEIKILLYEPYFEGSEIDGIPVIRDLNSFIINSELIIANRLSVDLEAVKDKVYSRDLFGEN
jgi:UDPglucose 6-dehydrogenase